MKFGIMFANAGPFAFPEGLENLARAAEDTGFESSDGHDICAY